MIPTDILAKLRRYARSPKDILAILRALRERRIIVASEFFDGPWYLRQNPEVGATNTDPALHYLVCGHAARRNPGPFFVGDEYLALNPDALSCGMNPLVHFEKIGRKRGARISFLESPADAAAGRHSRISLEDHSSSFAGKVAKIRAKFERGETIRVVFFVSTPSMFPARPLLDAMLRDPAFVARIAVIPDLRWADAKTAAANSTSCRDELSQDYPESIFIDTASGEYGHYPDVLGNADLACYPSPYDISDFRYNPGYAIGRDFLAIHVNYGFYRSIYDRRIMAQRNYGIFWKVFVECEETLAEYKEHSLSRGANAELVGYVKMDSLAKYTSAGGKDRKCILICPHHSVEGGLNNELSLSNFLRYSNDFLELPRQFPQIDFVMRPHPFLFKTLSRPEFWGSEKTAEWKRKWLANHNAAWSREGDYFRAFASSDACIQDCGSYLVEYFYTGKPQCYMLKSPADVGAKFAPLGQECLRNCRVAYSMDDIKGFIAGVATGDTGANTEELEDFRRRIMRNYPHAAEAALAAIKSELIPGCAR